MGSTVELLDKLAGMMGCTFPDEETQKVSRVHQYQKEFLGSEVGSSRETAGV